MMADKTVIRAMGGDEVTAIVGDGPPDGRQTRVPQQQVGIGIFAQCAKKSAQIQQRILAAQAEPEKQKRLRTFATMEAARMIGVSESYLRQLTRERDDLPSGTNVGGNNRRAFTLSEVNAIRGALFEQSGDRRYAPGRDRARGDKMQILTVCNFKGGAAKTTHAVHLAQYLALAGMKVLVVDLDSQASLTSVFGFQPDIDFSADDTLYPFLRDDVGDLRKLVRPTYWDNIDIIPANLSLYNAEFELPVKQYQTKDFKFWRLLSNGLAQLDDLYDVVVLDCPPSLGYLSINALFAATSMVIPVPPSMIDFSSTGAFFSMMHGTMAMLAAQEQQEKSFDFVRILVSKFSTSDRYHNELSAWMRSIFGSLTLESKMVMTTAIDAAGNSKETIYEMRPTGMKSTYDRAVEHLDAVNREIERCIREVWSSRESR
jgi:chromosome partitioning protein